MNEPTTTRPGVTTGPGGVGSKTRDHREHRQRIIITNRNCEERVGARDKLRDKKCRGLYVSRTMNGVSTFYVQIRDPFVGRSRCWQLGAYHRETFDVHAARAAVYALRGRIGAGENVFEAEGKLKAIAIKQGLTLAALVELRIAWMQVLEKKADGEMRPRIETWKNVASHLRGLVVPSLGKRLAAGITSDDIAALSNSILEGALGVPSVSNARHMRRAVSGLYRWAVEAGRNFVPKTCEPWRHLPKLPKEHARERVLSAEEIRILWHGLGREDMPWDRRVRLALKLELVTMLRGGELIGARRNELFDLDGANARFDVPLRRVKKRRVIQQPLSSLAVEIIQEALVDNDSEFIFVGRFGDAPLQGSTTSNALRGTKNPDGSVRTPGICMLLGLEPLTPHDLRRTAATLAGDLGFSDAWIAHCLDHLVSRDQNESVPSVTGAVYSLSKRMKEKRAVLDGVAAALREIIAGEEVHEAVQVAA